MVDVVLRQGTTKNNYNQQLTQAVSSPTPNEGLQSSIASVESQVVNVKNLVECISNTLGIGYGVSGYENPTVPGSIVTFAERLRKQASELSELNNRLDQIFQHIIG